MSHNKTILIVDDNLDKLDFLIEYLHQANFEVLVAQNGQKALERVEYVSPDIILLDVAMPGMDGFETCRHLKVRSEIKDVPIIFLTAASDTVDKITGFELGGVDYIIKPAQVEEVLARVKTHLTIRELQAQLQAQNDLLEERVKERTAELVVTNQHLKAEIEQRKLHQTEKDKLFDVVRQQNEHLRTLTTLLLESQQNKHKALAQTLRNQIGQKIHMLEMNLNLMSEILSVNREISAEVDPVLDVLGQVVSQIKVEISTVEDELNQPIAASQNPLLRLTGREREVLQLIAEGKSTSEIADILYISVNTVYSHRQGIMKKLDIHNMSDLIKFALQNLTVFQ